MREHRGVAREFLAERERRRILEVRAARLDQVLEFLGLGVEGLFKAFEAREEVVRRFNDGHDGERGRERVVRGLRHVDVVVRVNELVLREARLVAEVAAEDFDGAVREHFVHVHVRLRARTRLPDCEREVAVELALKGFVAGFFNGGGALVVELAELLVRKRAGALQEREGTDDLHRHLFNADLEVLVAAFGLGAPVLVVGDLDLAHRVLFDAELIHLDFLLSFSFDEPASLCAMCA